MTQSHTSVVAGWLIVVLALFSAASVRADSPAKAMTFAEAKKVLYRHIYNGNESDFYCGCTFTLRGNGAVPILESCGYQIRAQPNRARRIEAEHVMPASWFGKQRQCWQKGGRKNCTATDPVFAAMEGDLVNLVPAIGEVNADRSDFRFEQFASENAPSTYGMCDFHVDTKARKAQPRPKVRGDIARIHFYMRDTYDVRLSEQQIRLFSEWDRVDPVDDFECTRDARILKYQGNRNPYVAKHCSR